MDEFVAKKGKYYLNGKLLDPKNDAELIEKYIREFAVAIGEYEEKAMLGLI